MSSYLHIGTINYSVPDPPINTAYLPSEVEAQHYLYGFPFKPRLVARSNPRCLGEADGMEAYLKSKEIIPLGDMSFSIGVPFRG